MKKKNTIYSNPRARVFYVCCADLSVICKPHGRHTDARSAFAEAKRQKYAQVLSAGDYRELTGRSAAADYAKENG